VSVVPDHDGRVPNHFVYLYPQIAVHCSSEGQDSKC